jgi:hypothetical protein
MLEISPIAAEDVDNDRFERFKTDLILLFTLMNQSAICKKMKMGAGNFGKYRSGERPVTKAFINKFYHSFQQDLAELKIKPYLPGEELLGTVTQEDEKNVYNLLQKIDQKLSSLQEEVKAIGASQLRQEEALKKLGTDEGAK